MSNADAGVVIRLEGRVVDQAACPVADASVRLAPGNHTATTGADGGFAFDDLPPRRYRVSAHKADDFAPPLLAGPGETVILEMQLGTTVIAHVFADRAPVVGATLVLDHGLAAITDAEGTATIRGLAPRDYRGWLRAAGWAEEPVSLTVHVDPGGVVERFITLRPGARVEGVVRNLDGEPVADALVWVSTEGSIVHQAWSASDGTWSIVAGAGTYQLITGSRHHGQNAAATIECDGRTPQRDIALCVGPASPDQAVGGAIAGVVVDEAGHPIADARVAVLDTSETGASWVTRHAGQAQTDAHGRFEVETLEGPEYDVIIEAGPRGRRPENPVRHRVQTGDLDLRLVVAIGGTVSGRVMLDGRPLSYFGACLTAPDVVGSLPIGIRTADGRFTIRHLEAGSWSITLLGPGTRRKLHDFTIEPGQHLELGELAMERGQRLAGHVRDRFGAAVAGARVVIGNIRLAKGLSRLQQAFTGYYETTTDTDGAYAFDAIDSQGAQLQRIPHVQATHVHAGVSVLQALSPTDTTLDFTLLGSGRIAGVVEGMRGGRASIRVARAGELALARMAHADAQGRFELDDIPPGDHVVGAPEGDHVHVTVVADQTAMVTIVMSGTSVELIVRVPPGRSRDLVVEPTSSGAGIGGSICMIERTGTEDLCRYTYVRPGEYRLSLDRARWLPVTVVASIVEQTIDLRLP